MLAFCQLGVSFSWHWGYANTGCYSWSWIYLSHVTVNFLKSRAIVAPLPYGQTECSAVNKDKGETHTHTHRAPEFLIIFYMTWGKQRWTNDGLYQNRHLLYWSMILRCLYFTCVSIVCCYFPPVRDISAGNAPYCTTFIWQLYLLAILSIYIKNK